MISVLFARADSVYKTLSGCDVYDLVRDAKTFNGGMPVIAHPPCRGWGRLRHLAKLIPGERDLAIWAVEQVRLNGGVLEHPAYSRLWCEANLPSPGYFDEFGGFTLDVCQYWWGHKALKPTWLYVCGINRDHVPTLPYRAGEPEYVIAKSKNNPHGKKCVTHKEREATPVDLATWLIDLASRCGGKS